MAGILPIGIEILLAPEAVESARLELKGVWDPETVGPQILRTISAFANDLQALNGGYLVLGVEEEAGRPRRPVRGLDPCELDLAQRWIAGNCKRLQPEYMPVLSIETLDQRTVLVAWVPASDVRPHQAPAGAGKGSAYYVRVGGATLEATGALRDRLIQQTARVPFDDRAAPGCSIEDLRESRVRDFLRDVKSDLATRDDFATLCRSGGFLRAANGHEVPRNVALLFFGDDPEKWFRGARIEAAEFADDAGGNLIAERAFRGSLPDQVTQCLAYLESLRTLQVQKAPERAAARGWASYPAQALREAVVNAVYHRSYESCPEPVKVYLYPDRIEVISYPGPVDGIDAEHLTGDKPLPPVPARNRRVGELLKDLRLAEQRGTGIPKIHRSMRENGSPAPRFDFDAGRTFFRLTLPAHPEYVVLGAIRDAAYLRASGDLAGALRRLSDARRARPDSPALTVALIREWASRGNLEEARAAFAAFPGRDRGGFAGVVAALADAYLAAGLPDAARRVLDDLPERRSPTEAWDAAILERRAGRDERAHALFASTGESVFEDARATHEFAQAKIGIAGTLRRRPGPGTEEARLRMLREAESILERIVATDAPPMRRAHAWFDLARVRSWLKRANTAVAEALGKAQELAPDEPRIQRGIRGFEPGRR